MADMLCYLAQVVGAILFAFVCEVWLKRRYEPDYTLIPATIGIAQVGLIVAARLVLAPAPQLWPQAVAWWTWWLVFWSFIWAFIPIAIWQLAVQHGRIAQLTAYLRRKAGR